MVDDDNMSSPSSTHAEEAVVECGICGFVGVESVSMAHADAEHAMRPVYECGHCGFVFWKEFDLSLHLRGVHSTARGKPMRECMFCALLFDSPAALNCHLRKLHAVCQPIMCRFCGILCYGGDMVARHIQETHASAEFLYCNAKTHSDGAGTPEGKPGKCSAFFMSSEALAEHMRLGHGVARGNTCDSVESGDGSGGNLVTKGRCPSAQGGIEDVAGINSEQLAAPGSLAVTTMNVPMDVPMGVPMHNAGGSLPLAKDEEALQCLSPSAETNLACVVCGLKLNKLSDLNKHMSRLHRTCEAEPVEITLQSLEATISESPASPDGVKRSTRGMGANSKQKNKLNKSLRWTPELDELFLRAIRERGFSNDTLAAFQVLHTSDRSMASLRARGYQKGFKMVRSARRESQV